MPSQLKSLAVLFNERVFRIPDYQRGYSWNERHLEDFWQDLNRLPDGRNHYTGQITLEPVSEERWKQWDEDTWLIADANCKPYYVVDGQQRLTTAIILVKAILELVAGDDTEVVRTPKYQLVAKYLVRKSGPSKAFIFGYEKDNPSYEFLKTQVLGEASNQYQGVRTVYTGNLSFALGYFKKCLDALDAQKREELFKRLTQRLVFNEYEIDDDLDVFVAFETMNNRGKPLSHLELLKNRLIYLSTLMPAPEGQRLTLRRNINDAWKTVYEFLGKEEKRPLDDDKFLRAHWVMSFDYARDQANQYASFLLEEHFTPDRATSGKVSVPDLQTYVSSVQAAARAWDAVHFPYRAGEWSEAVRNGLDRLNRVGQGAFGPLAMAILVKPLPEQDIVRLLDEAERFVFLVSHCCNRRSDTGDSDFLRLAGKLYRNECNLGEVASRIRERSTKHFEAERFRLEMSDRFKEDDGFYSWSGLRYFLFEYEQSLKGRNQSDKIQWEDFVRTRKEHVTVEHIYPRSPKSAEWSSFDAYSAPQQHQLRHSLGNLLPLSRQKNASLSNRRFEEKRNSDGAGYFNGSYSEINVATVEDWTPARILSRGLSLLDFLEKRWAVTLGSRAEKVALLQLEFLLPSN